MAIPDFQSIMLPLLRYCADGQEKYFADAIDAMAKAFNLSDHERAEMLDSGRPRIENRVGWARTHLKAAGLIEPTRRGYFRITERGKKLLGENPTRIDLKTLQRYSEFQEFRKRKPKQNEETEGSDTDNLGDVTPEEALESAYGLLRAALENDLLRQVKECTPAFFERLVVDLLVKMGYGGTRQDAGKAIGSSGDGGIDGIIKEDRLGLGVIYIQAKKWEESVGRPVVQQFAGRFKANEQKEVSYSPPERLPVKPTSTRKA